MFEISIKKKKIIVKKSFNSLAEKEKRGTKCRIKTHIEQSRNAQDSLLEALQHILVPIHLAII